MNKAFLIIFLLISNICFGQLTKYKLKGKAYYMFSPDSIVVDKDSLNLCKKGFNYLNVGDLNISAILNHGKSLYISSNNKLIIYKEKNKVFEKDTIIKCSSTINNIFTLSDSTLLLTTDTNVLLYQDYRTDTLWRDLKASMFFNYNNSCI